MLREIAAEAGLDPEEAADVLKKGTFRDAVLQDWDYSARCGIVAAPTYRMGTHRLVGATPTNGWPPRGKGGLPQAQSLETASNLDSQGRCWALRRPEMGSGPPRPFRPLEFPGTQLQPLRYTVAIGGSQQATEYGIRNASPTPGGKDVPW